MASISSESNHWTVATAQGSFTADDSLGERVVLPPFLEAQRAQIVGNLKPID
jgi:hypothetical protein